MGSIAKNLDQLKKFLASISTIKGDLSNITAPPFVLAPKSAVEFPAAWAEHPAVLVAPAAEDDPKRRALLVLKWYLSSLKRQQYSASTEEEGVKKPLNAFLGELFIASFDGADSTTNLVSEQVSHHPPVTACYVWNEKHGVRAEGYTAQKITLTRSATVQINQIGHAFVHIDKFDESYLVSLPTLTVKGLLSGTPYPELSGTTYISSTSGFTSKIDYEGKSLFSSTKKNTFRATLYRSDAPDEILYTVEGQWNESFTFRDNVNDKDIEVYDTNAEKLAPMSITDASAQDSWESRKAWRGVIDSIHAGNMQAISDEKNKVEVAQRELRKREKVAGDVWQQAMFARHEDEPLFHRLAKDIGETLRAEETNGVWKLDWDKFTNAKPPYHGNVTPLG